MYVLKYKVALCNIINFNQTNLYLHYQRDVSNEIVCVMQKICTTDYQPRHMYLCEVKYPNYSVMFD